MLDVKPDGDDFIAELRLLEKRRLRGYDWTPVDNTLCGFYVAKPGDSVSVDAEGARFVRYMQNHIVASMSDVSLPLMCMDVNPVEIRGSSVLVEASPALCGDLSPSDFWSDLTLDALSKKPTAEVSKMIFEPVFLSFSKYHLRSDDPDALRLQRTLQFGSSDISTLLRVSYAHSAYRKDYMRLDGMLIEDVLSRLFLTEEGVRFTTEFVREYRRMKQLKDYSEAAKQFIWLHDIKFSACPSEGNNA